MKEENQIEMATAAEELSPISQRLLRALSHQMSENTTRLENTVRVEISNVRQEVVHVRAEVQTVDGRVTTVQQA